MRIKLLLDEDVQVELSRALKARDFDAPSVQELGRKGLSDDDQLMFASNDNRTFFTYNVKDFVELHREFIIEGKEHYGIIVSRQRPIGAALKRLLSLMNTLSAEDMRNRFEFLSDWKEERNSFCL